MVLEISAWLNDNIYVVYEFNFHFQIQTRQFSVYIGVGAGGRGSGNFALKNRAISALDSGNKDSFFARIEG